MGDATSCGVVEKGVFVVDDETAVKQTSRHFCVFINFVSQVNVLKGCFIKTH